MDYRKNYLCIGDYVVGNDGENHYVFAIHLPRLYRVHPDSCVFTDQETLQRFRHLAEYEKLIWLRPRTDGRYILPQHSLCKCGTLMLWVKTKDGKRMPINCHHSFAEAKVFDAVAGMVSHFATCSLHKQFRKTKGAPHGQTQAGVKPVEPRVDLG